MRVLSLFLMLLIGCMSSGKNDLQQAKVVSASLGITTPFAVPCHLLDTLLASALEARNVKSSDLDELASLLPGAESTTVESIDVRGKLILTRQGEKSDTLCFDQFGVFYDGTDYSKNERLLKFLIANKLVIP